MFSSVDDINKYSRSVKFVNNKINNTVNFFNMPDYSLKIKQLRAALGLNQKDFAKKLRVAPGTINRYENKKSEPDKNILEIFAKELDVNINWYLADQGEMFLTSKPKKEEIPESLLKAIKEEVKKELDERKASLANLASSKEKEERTGTDE